MHREDLIHVHRATLRSPRVSQGVFLEGTVDRPRHPVHPTTQPISVKSQLRKGQCARVTVNSPQPALSDRPLSAIPSKAGTSPSVAMALLTNFILMTSLSWMGVESEVWGLWKLGWGQLLRWCYAGAPWLEPRLPVPAIASLFLKTAWVAAVLWMAAHSGQGPTHILPYR